jgi:predicted enzyme related to lactoylglutathione lyase
MTENAWSRTTVWHELMATNPDRAKAFYQAVVGLKTEPLEGGPFPYTVWTQAGAPIGGLVPPQAGQKGWPSGETPHWVSSFAVDDVEQAVKRAEALGGEVLVPPTEIPRFGKAAVLKDLDGAVFGVFQGQG